MFMRTLASVAVLVSIAQADVLDTALAADDACSTSGSADGCSVELLQLKGDVVKDQADDDASEGSLVDTGFGSASVCVQSRGCSRNDKCQKLANGGGHPISGTVDCKRCAGARKCQIFGHGTSFTCGCTVALLEEDASVTQDNALPEENDDDEAVLEDDAEDDSEDEDEQDEAGEEGNMALTQESEDEVVEDEDAAGSEGRRRSWFDSPRCCRCKYGNKIGWSRSGKCSFCGHKSIFGSYAYKRRVKPSATKCRNAKSANFPGSRKCAKKCYRDV